MTCETSHKQLLTTDLPKHPVLVGWVVGDDFWLPSIVPRGETWSAIRAAAMNQMYGKGRTCDCVIVKARGVFYVVNPWQIKQGSKGNAVNPMWEFPDRTTAVMAARMGVWR